MFDIQAIEAADEEGVDEYGFGAAVLDFYRTEVPKAHDSRMNHYDQSLHADTKLKIDPTFRGGDRVPNAHILKAIIFRAKFQRSCLGLVLFLYEHGLLTLAGLQEPMYVNNPPNPVLGSVFCALAIFEIFSRSMDFPFETYTEFFGY
ncbi:uncharacterized protein RSE6_09861 [Rhynchosporium secalis]|uniref:Uncharacterized protein n=1 Tax=Rhynchosporium secalis TaxID=38038 RepID=A0A1E1MJ24_RHYSE|nr:uncharacterized protein RSE6_09861 [Rhynchosporium secalis]